MIFDKGAKQQPNHGLSLSDRAPAIAVIGFAICIVGITFAGSDLTYLFFDTAKNLAAFWIAFFFCPYDQLRVKSALFGIVINEIFTTIYATSLFIGVEFMPYEYGYIFPLIVLMFYLSVIARLQLAKEIESQEPEPIEDCVYLIPIQTWRGLAQCLFLPWHSGRYESRVVVASGMMYLVHSNRFRKVEARLTDLPESAICIPLGRRLSQSEIQKLDRLVGKSAFPLFRDCRKLISAIDDF